MKTTKFLSAALFVFAAISCNTENFLEPTESALEPMYISGTATKTVFTPADGRVSWTADDKLAIFDNQGGKNIFNNSETSVALFSGQVKAGTTKFWGVYPAENVKSENIADGTVIVDLPADQTPTAGTFAEDLNISVTTGYKTVGEPSVDGITFHNVCGLISFKLPERIAADTVTFTANRDIAGKLSVNCENGDVKIVEDGSKSVSMSGNFTKGSTFYFVVTPGEIKGFSIYVKTIHGSEYRLGTAEGDLNVVAGEYINLPNIDLKDGDVSVSASHTYSNGDDGVLTGSSLTVNHGIPSQLWNDVKDFTLSVKNKKDGKVYRSYDSTVNNSTVNSATVTPTGSVYLPQGEYEITGSYKMNGVIKYISATAELPAPEFSVTSAGTTSYSLYKSGKSSEANTHKADKISSISATCTISDKVLAELSANYSVSLGGSVIKSGSTNASKVTADEQTKSQGTYDLSASFTFDGVTEKCSTDCHITGLPYSVDLNTDSYPSGWTLNNCGLTDDRLVFKQSTASALTPSFHVPGNINITSYLVCYAYGGSINGSYNPKVVIAASNSVTSSGTSTTLGGRNGVPDYAKRDPIGTELTLTTSAKKVSFYVTGSGSKWSVGSATMGVICDSYSITYR